MTSYTFMHGATHRVGTVSVLPGSLDRGIALRRGPRPRYRATHGGAARCCSGAGIGNPPVHPIADRAVAVGIRVVAETLRRSDEQRSCCAGTRRLKPGFWRARGRASDGQRGDRGRGPAAHHRAAARGESRPSDRTRAQQQDAGPVAARGGYRRTHDAPRPGVTHRAANRLCPRGTIRDEAIPPATRNAGDDDGPAAAHAYRIRSTDRLPTGG